MKTSKFMKALFLPLALAGLLSGQAHATSFPERPVRIIVGFAPGGANDILARLIAKELGDVWGQTVVVENKPGANGVIAFEQLARANPDGYTLGLGTAGPTTMNQALQSLPFDILQDFTPIVHLVDMPHALAINAKLPANSLTEFIEYAKQADQPLAYSSPGVGNSGHLAMEMLKQRTQTDLTHVAYRGAAPALNDLIAGHVQAYFTSAAALLPHADGGTIKVLAVTADENLSSLPQVPTMSEAGVEGFELPVYGGLLGPKDMPAEVVEKINQSAVAVLASPTFLEALKNNAMVAVGGSPDEFRQFLASDLKRWQQVVEDANIKL
ncbi:MAG: tripartite tricarboxylate transporter substrate binding protein [Pigmentiphaga sp.]|nr:tripartite tricarboxylate transporter substrate binding protein [Pigmentiphaga sp.]